VADALVGPVVSLEKPKLSSSRSAALRSSVAVIQNSPVIAVRCLAVDWLLAVGARKGVLARVPCFA